MWSERGWAKRMESELRGLAKVHSVDRTKRQLKPFVKAELVTVRTDRFKTPLGNFRSVRPEFVIRKRVRLNVNFAVSEYSIAVLAVQSPLGLRHGQLSGEGQVSLSPIMPKLNRLKMFNNEHSTAKEHRQTCGSARIKNYHGRRASADNEVTSKYFKKLWLCSAHRISSNR